MPEPEMPKLYTVKKGEISELDTSLRAMCKIAKGRLDSSLEVLKILYVDNAYAPEALRNLFKEFVEKKINKAEITDKLDQLSI